jgi:hypothetical protein
MAEYRGDGEMGRWGENNRIYPIPNTPKKLTRQKQIFVLHY